VENAPSKNIWHQLDGREAVQVVANREGQEWAQPQQRHHLEAFFANGLVNSYKLGVLLGDLENTVTSQVARDQKRDGCRKLQGQVLADKSAVHYFKQPPDLSS
jgi:hypothetical protein